MTKHLSYWRVNEMKEVFQQLNRIPIETRKRWYIPYDNYDFAIEVCDTLLARLKRESNRVKASTERTRNKRIQEYLSKNKEANS